MIHMPPHDALPISCGGMWPGLVYSGVIPLQDPYEGEDPDAICNHGEGVPLGHALLAVQEVARPVLSVSDYACGPVVVAVVYKPRVNRAPLGQFIYDITIISFI